MREKIHRFNVINQSMFSNINEVTSVFSKEEVTSRLDKNHIRTPLPVKVLPTKQTLLGELTQLSPLLSPLGTGLLTIIFLLYILCYRQDIRERFILLISHGDLNLATQAIDDTVGRITRYLLLNLSTNGCYGIFIGLGLYCIGIPNAFLWGLLTMFLRFMPYLGILVATTLPSILAFAIDPGWSLLIKTLGLFLFAELITTNLLEPRLYGASTGISSFALMVASIFWIWLWGVVGLFLSVPLTVCLFMLGKYVAGLEFLEIILGRDLSF